MINDFSIIQNINILKNSNIILYGASSVGKRTLSLLKQANINVVAFCDSNPRESHIDDIHVYSPLQIKDHFTNTELLIIITSTFVTEIFDTLVSLDLHKKNKIITYYALNYSIDCNYDNPIFPIEFQTDYRKKRKFINVINDQNYLQHTRQLDFSHLIEIANQQDPILVYQPGKVGSKTIYRSLQSLNLPAIHLHRLAWNEKLWKSDIQDCKSSYEYYINLIKNKKIKIITAIREPISRDISNFMHNLADERWITYNFTNKDLNESFNNVIYNYYIDKKPSHSTYSWLDISWNQGIHGQMFEWFDYEIRNVFGIDIYDYPFNKELGYQIIRKNNVEIFIYKLEKLSSLQDVLSQFLGVSEFELKSDNVGEQKSYKYLYNEFKKNLQIPSKYFDFYYKNNIRMDYFYTSTEKELFREKWKQYVI